MAIISYIITTIQHTFFAWNGCFIRVYDHEKHNFEIRNSTFSWLLHGLTNVNNTKWLYGPFTFTLTYDFLFLSFSRCTTWCFIAIFYINFVAIVFLSLMNVDMPIPSMSKTISWGNNVFWWLVWDLWTHFLCNKSDISKCISLRSHSEAQRTKCSSFPPW